MSRPTEQEIIEILDAYKDAPLINPNKVYPPLPPAENTMPLMRIPGQVTLCEKIGSTEYTVTAHFREDGQDLPGLLSRVFMRDTADYSFDFEDCDGDDGREGESNSIVNQEYICQGDFTQEMKFPKFEISVSCSRLEAPAPTPAT